MAITRWRKDDSFFPSFSPIFDDFFGKGYMNNFNTGTTIPAVNVKEEKDKYNIELAAPGLKKEDFKIDLNHNILTISSEQKDEISEKDEEGKYTRREYSFHSFSRSFTLPDNIDGQKVEATYKDGVLEITVPKKDTSVSEPKQIEIK